MPNQVLRTLAICRTVDSAGDLLYRELILNSSNASIIAAPNSDGTESLVLLSGKSVRSYQLKLTAHMD